MKKIFVILISIIIFTTACGNANNNKQVIDNQNDSNKTEKIEKFSKSLFS